MSSIKIRGIKVENYRSFGEAKYITFPTEGYKKPIAIVGYNNAGKTNLLNAMLYGIREKYVNVNTFTRDDFHNRDFKNIPRIVTGVTSSIESRADGKSVDLTGYHFLDIYIDGNEIEEVKINSFEDQDRITPNYKTFGAIKYYKVFYINFHEIKKEISTKKTSWGNLTSFLAKHIQGLVEKDQAMQGNRDKFKSEIKSATKDILLGSQLESFVDKIQFNYSKNLRDNNCNIEFGLPDYEDIFLEMMFKIGLNGDADNLIPLDHFGDGYISMFVMAVIQAIAEENTEDECLFLFEEPESFLHENHQEYFYKTVLCGLAENNHQVIYTTHSDKMIDIFETRSIVRLEFDEEKKQTEVKYNESRQEFLSTVEFLGSNQNGTIDRIRDYNNYIKIIEPNLNKIIFSKKVLLVEGPNDMMVYKEIIRRKVFEKTNDTKYAETYLNFKNIAIIPHHGKITALVLIKLCEHLGLDYFVINDFDFDDDLVHNLCFTNEKEYKESNFYNEEIERIEIYNAKGEELSLSTKKAMMTTNWRLINNSKSNQIHFNIPKLENLINYDKGDKSSYGIWSAINNMEKINENLFPNELIDFLGISEL